MGSASGWSASPLTDQQSGRGTEEIPAVESVTEPSLTTEVQNVSTGGAPTAAAAVNDATAPVEVNESLSAPEASASQRADHPAECEVRRLPPISIVEQPYRRRERDDDASVDAAFAATIVGAGDTCAASVATEPPWSESRGGEIAPSPAVTSAWPSSTTVEQPYRRRERDDNMPMDAASTVTIAGPSDACAVTSAAEPPWKEQELRRDDQVASPPAGAIAFPSVLMTPATRPVDHGDSRCGALDVRHCMRPGDEDRTIRVGDRRVDTERQRPVTEPTTDPSSETTVDNLNFMLRATPPLATLHCVVQLGVTSDAIEINDAGETAAAFENAEQQSAGGTADTPLKSRMFIHESELHVVASREATKLRESVSVVAGDGEFTTTVAALPRGPSTDHTPCQQTPPGPRNGLKHRRGQRPGQRRNDARARHRLKSRPLRDLINRSALDRLLRLQSSLGAAPRAAETDADVNRCGGTLRRSKGSMRPSGQLDTLLTWLHAPG
jgi:hypothetical protein